MDKGPQHEAGDLELAGILADEARYIALQYFRSGNLCIDNKKYADNAFDPVTAADREIEKRLRETLAKHRPDDSVMGEEHENTVGTSGRSWVIDPIDGTRAFMCGLPTWGVLIALNNNGRPFLGVMDQPFTGERYIGFTGAETARAAYNRGDVEKRLRVRDCDDPADAVMCSTAPDAFGSAEDAAAFARLSEHVRLTRFGTDCYGYAMLASGHIDLVVESGLQAYDVQAMIPIVEASGGVMTDWQGRDCSGGGQVIAAGSEALHAKALQILTS